MPGTLVTMPHFTNPLFILQIYYDCSFIYADFQLHSQNAGLFKRIEIILAKNFKFSWLAFENRLVFLSPK